MTPKINYIQKNRIQCTRHCDLRIVLIFNKKNKYKKNVTKIFIVLNVILRVQITNIWHII